MKRRDAGILRFISGSATDPRRRFGFEVIEALLLIAMCTAIAFALEVNAATAGLLLLGAVLLVASRNHLGVATISAVTATLSYNFFFFPPKGTLTIDEGQNWVALLTFLFTSLVANRLMVRERHQAEMARRSREAIEALYDLSVALLREGGGMEEVGSHAVRYLERIGAASGGVIRFGASPQHQQLLAWTGPPASEEIEEIAAGVTRHGRPTNIPSRFGRDVCLPLFAGERAAAALVVRGTIHSFAALESAATLLAFAIERERFLHERARIGALREADQLKTSLLHAVAHDLRSPLTVLMVESEALERVARQPGAELHVKTIRDEVARLHRRISKLLSAARFEAGIVSPHPEPTPAADLFRAARENLPIIARTRSIETTVALDTPDVLADPSLAVEIIVNLIENAHQAAPPATAIELAAFPGDVLDRVQLEIRDRGTGLPAGQLRRVRVMETAGGSNPGLGIELARTLAALSGGNVEWLARPGGGTIARLELPAAPVLDEEST